MDIDWLKASEDQRKQLYVATRAVADAGNTTVEEIMDAALGRKALMGTDYMSTFRGGKIRKSYAKLIHGWIAGNHIETANNIAPDLFPLPHTDAWDSYIETHGIRGKLQIKRFAKNELNLIKKVKVRDAPDATLKLGEEFCFFLKSDLRTHAIGFERYKEKWHVMPLGPNGSHTFLLQSDEAHFPIDINGEIERLTEESDLDIHRFAFVVSKNANDLPRTPDIKDIGQAANLHYIDVLFSV
ncbi:MAG: hypothetical protein JXQ89_04180 [Pelagimonas sp.]